MIHRHLTWYSESLLLGVVWDMTTQSDQLYEYQLTHSEDDYHIKLDIAFVAYCYTVFVEWLMCGLVKSLYLLFIV